MIDSNTIVAEEKNEKGITTYKEFKDGSFIKYDELGNVIYCKDDKGLEYFARYEKDKKVWVKYSDGIEVNFK